MKIIAVNDTYLLSAQHIVSVEKAKNCKLVIKMSDGLSYTIHVRNPDNFDAAFKELRTHLEKA